MTTPLSMCILPFPTSPMNSKRISSLASQTLYPLNHQQFVRKGLVNSIFGLVCTKFIVLSDDMYRTIIGVDVLSQLIHVEKDYSIRNKISCFHILSFSFLFFLFFIITVNYMYTLSHTLTVKSSLMLWRVTLCHR